MRSIIGLALALCGLCDMAIGQTTYYFRGTATDPANVLTNWRTTRSGGSGTTPAAFSGATDTWDFNERSGNISSWTVAGNVTNTKNGGGAVTLATLTLDAASTVSVGGAITATNIAFTLGAGSTFTYNGAAQTVVALNYQNLSLTGTGTKTAAGAMGVAGNLQLASGVTLNMSTFDLSGSALTTSGTGQLKTSSVSATPLPAGRSWSFGVDFEAAGNQTIPGGAYAGLGIAGGGIKGLAAAASVAGTLTLGAGKVNTGTFTLTLTNATPASQLSGGSATSYVYSTGAGRLRRNGLPVGTAFPFPVGTATYYMPVTVEALDATSDFAVNVFQGLTQDGTPGGTPFVNKAPVVDAVWNVDRPTGTGDALLTLAWDPALEGSSFAGFTNAEIGISHYLLGNWQLATGSGNNTNNTATALFSSFSPFAVGKTGTVLPLQFSRLQALEQRQGVQLEWTVLTDQRVSSYVVERAADGRSFQRIGTVDGGQQSLGGSYSFFDASPVPTGYYRILALQADGRGRLSPVLRVNLRRLGREVLAYPNPIVNRNFSLQATGLERGQYTLRLYNVQGQEWMQQRLEHNGGALNQLVWLPAGTAPGMYMLYLDQDGTRMSGIKLMVQ